MSPSNVTAMQSGQLALTASPFTRGMEVQGMEVQVRYPCPHPADYGSYVQSPNVSTGSTIPLNGSLFLFCFDVDFWFCFGLLLFFFHNPTN